MRVEGGRRPGVAELVGVWLREAFCEVGAELGTEFGVEVKEVKEVDEEATGRLGKAWVALDESVLSCLCGGEADPELELELEVASGVPGTLSLD